MKDLPKVFQNNVDKKFNNNSSVYYSSNDNRSLNIEEVKDEGKVIENKIGDESIETIK